PEIAQHVVSTLAPSKTFNLAGLSSSFLVIPNKKLFQLYENRLNTIHIGHGNIFGNIALEAAYNKGEIWLEELMGYLQKNVNFLRNFLSEHLPQIKLIEPEGTYLLWLDFRNLKLNQKDLNQLLIHQANIGLNDGAMFGEGGEGFQRINIACPRSILKKALEQIHEAIKKII
ncbi:MAG TPA: cystathionine beta-lyase, partial [Bacteroidales bacterium]|nr:cystathionine beta-lyase [Bacteroidales bacterium]